VCVCVCVYVYIYTHTHTSIYPMALQPKSGLGLSCWVSIIIIIFYSVRLLASWTTPVNFGGPMIFYWGFTPLAKGSSFKALKTCPPSHFHLLHNPLCLPLDHHEEADSLGLLAERAGWIHGSFLVFNRACLLASACPTTSVCVCLCVLFTSAVQLFNCQTSLYTICSAFVERALNRSS
jgi:hypothetical protein